MLRLPIVLGASQTWSIDGGSAGGYGMIVSGAVSGSSNALQIALSRITDLYLGGSDTDDEVGPVSISGSNRVIPCTGPQCPQPPYTGSGAYLNGSVILSGSLNATDGNAVKLTDAGLSTGPFDSPTVGPLSSTGGFIDVGVGISPAGTLTVNGGVTLDSASGIQLIIDGSGSTAGTDYSQLRATGAVRLGGSLNLVRGGSESCPSLTMGSVYTLITTTGVVYGMFTGVPDGHDITFCGGTVRINYTAHSVTATAVTPAAANGAGPGQGPSASPATIRQALRAMLDRTVPVIGQITRHGGATITFNAPSPGHLQIIWTSRPAPGAARDARARKLVRIAHADVWLQHAGRAKIKIRLTKPGRRLLKRAGRIRVLVKASFTPTGASITTITRTITLKR